MRSPLSPYHPKNYYITHQNMPALYPIYIYPCPIPIFILIPCMLRDCLRVYRHHTKNAHIVTIHNYPRISFPHMYIISVIYNTYICYDIPRRSQRGRDQVRQWQVVMIVYPGLPTVISWRYAYRNNSNTSRRNLL